MSKSTTYSTAYREGVQEEMARDSTIFVLGTDLRERGGHFAQVKGLAAEFGHDRIRDAPISEAAMVAAGVGAALSGARPLVDLNFADFSFGAFDEIANQAAKIRYMWDRKVPMVIRATSGVALGGAQHNNSLEMIFASIPGLAVVSPATAYDAKGLIKSALRAEDPVIFLMHKKLTGARGVAGGVDELVPLGKANRVRRGDDVTIVTYSYGLSLVTEAAESLAQSGISADVIDLRSIYPLDLHTILASVRRTGRLVLVDEAPRFGGISGAIAASIQERAFWHLDAPIGLINGAQSPIPHSPDLIEALLPSPRRIVDAVHRAMGK